MTRISKKIRRFTACLLAAVMVLCIAPTISADTGAGSGSGAAITNVYDKSKAYGGFLDGSGNGVFHLGHYTSDFIAVSAGDVVRMAPSVSGQGYYLMTFDTNKAVLEMVGGGGVTAELALSDGTFVYAYTVPAGVSYVRVVNSSFYNDKFVVTVNQTLSEKALAGYFASVDPIVNLYKKDKAQNGYLNPDGSFVDYAEHYTSDYIAVSAGETIYMAPHTAQGYYLLAFDADKNAVAQVDAAGVSLVETMSDGTFIYAYSVPAGVSYIRVTNRAAYHDKFVITANQPLTEAVLSDYYKTENKLVNRFNKTRAVNAFLNGDGSENYSFDGHYTSSFITVRPGDVLYMAPCVDQGYFMMTFDGTKTPMQMVVKDGLTLVETMSDGTAVYAYTIPDGVFYIRIVDTAAYNDKFVATINQPLSAEILSQYYYGDTASIKNLYDKDKAVNAFLDADGSENYSWNGHYTSEYIAVKSGDVLYMAPCVDQGYFMMTFDGAKTPMQMVVKDGLTLVETMSDGTAVYAYAVPDGVSYVRVVNTAAYNDKFVITINESLSEKVLTEYWASQDDGDASALANLYEKTTAFNGFIDAEGNKVNYANHYTSDFIEVAAGDVLYMAPCPAQGYYLATYKGGAFAGLVDASNAALKKVGDFTGGTSIYAYTVPEGVTSVRVSNTAAYNDRFMITRNQKLTTKNFAAYWAAMDAQRPDMSGSVLWEKAVLFSGDSISYGAGDSIGGRAWGGRIGDLYSMDWINASISGASVSTARGANRMINQLARHTNKTFDYVILHGGTNDAWEKTPIGKMSDSFDLKSFDNKTFAGGLEELLYYAHQYYRSAKFGYIINFRFNDDLTIGYLNNMKEYVDMTKKICDKWGVPYLDLYSNEELSAKLKLNTPDHTDLVPDNIHPNHLGYEIITPYVAAWMETVVAAQAEKENPTPEPMPYVIIEAESGRFTPEDKVEKYTPYTDCVVVSGFQNMKATYTLGQDFEEGRYRLSAYYVSAVQDCVLNVTVNGKTTAIKIRPTSNDWDWSMAVLGDLLAAELKAGDVIELETTGSMPWIQIDYLRLTRMRDGEEFDTTGDGDNTGDEDTKPVRNAVKIEAESGVFTPADKKEMGTSGQGNTWISGFQNMTASYKLGADFVAGEYRLNALYVTPVDDCKLAITVNGVTKAVSIAPSDNADAWDWNKAKYRTLTTLNLKPGDTIEIKATGTKPWIQIDYFQLVPTDMNDPIPGTGDTLPLKALLAALAASAVGAAVIFSRRKRFL